MKSDCFKKSLVIIILVLLVGASISISKYNKTEQSITEVEGWTNAAVVNNCDCDETKQTITESEGWTDTPDENLAEKYSIEELCGLVEPEDWWVGAEFDPCLPTESLPDSFDWRALGGCTPIKNQGGCGSCWAFGTISAIECKIKIDLGVTVDLSEQWLVSCNQDGYSCSGGWWCHEYFKEVGTKTDPCGHSGAVLESDFPYTASNAPCGCPYPHEYFIGSWAYVGPIYGVATVGQIKQAIYDYGPVSVAVCVNTAFRDYDGGIFSGPSCSNINHAVAIVGWDDNQGTEGVWFLRNSWGTGWGEGGYMRIEYGVSNVGYRTVRVGSATHIENDPPYAPSNPDPGDGETGVYVDADLSWTCSDPDGDPLTYDVYFEADDPSPDVLVSSDQSDTSYDPGTMNYDTTYYWQIVATDEYGQSEGPVWDFETAPPWNYPPGNPVGPIGPPSLYVAESGEYCTMSTDPEGDMVQYRFDWDANGGHDYSGWTDLVPSKTEDCMDHSWSSPGTYLVKAQAKDENGASSVWSSGLTVEVSYNTGPNSPSTPSGPLSLYVGETGEYCTSATDPDGDMVQYRFDWDADGGHDYSGWTDLVPSGTEDCMDHSWSSSGTYLVKVQAKDEHGDTSVWSSGLTVEVSDNTIPNIPSTPSGPPSLYVGESGGYCTMSTDPDDDMVQYRFDWDADGGHDYSGWTDLVPSGTEDCMDHSWSSSGTYLVKVQAKDVHDAVSDWSDGLIVFVGTAAAPEIPNIDGPTSGKAGEFYDYDFNAIDPDGDNVSYYIKWGDGDITDWTDFQASGTSYSESHTWSAEGTYSIEAKAKDIYGVESDWATLSVTMPRINRAINTQFLQFLQESPNTFQILMHLLGL